MQKTSHRTAPRHAAIALGAHFFEPDPSGALWWAETATLIVADLHLEKGSFFARTGQFLPPYDTRTTLGRLRRLTERLNPARVIALGDSFHDADGSSRLDPADRAALDALARGRDWVWIAGNHDRAGLDPLGGRVLAAFEPAADLVFRHEAAHGSPGGEISGHYHPKVSVALTGVRLSGRCFAGDGCRLILPAFGAYAGGLDVGSPVFAALFPDGFDVWLTGRDRVLHLPRALGQNRQRRLVV